MTSIYDLPGMISIHNIAPWAIMVVFLLFFVYGFEKIVDIYCTLRGFPPVPEMCDCECHCSADDVPEDFSRCNLKDSNDKLIMAL